MKNFKGIFQQWQNLNYRWNQALVNIKSYNELPSEAKSYLDRIEELAGIPLSWIGFSTNENSFIKKYDDWVLYTFNEIILQSKLKLNFKFKLFLISKGISSNEINKFPLSTPSSGKFIFTLQLIS